MSEAQFTKLKNIIIDDYLTILSGNEIKCYLFILRKTIGWNKQKDKISISQFIKRTGIKKRLTVINSISKLIELNLILCHKKLGLINVYEPLPVAIKDTSSHKGYYPPVAKKDTRVVAKKDTPTSSQKGYSTKDTITKDTIIKTLKSKPKKETLISYPDNLNLKAWQLWEQHKKEKKQTYKPTGAKIAINKLIVLSHDNQMHCIENSISNNYSGFFTDKFNGVHNGNNQNGFRKETAFDSNERAIKNLLTSLK